MNERDIIHSVLRGDTGRFETLVERYLPMVRGLCAGRVFSTAAHDDLVQETFVESYLHLDRLRNPDRFGPWLVAIAKNKCREWMRQQQRQVRLAERLSEEIPPVLDPLQELSRQELREWVRRRIASLPEKLRDAMMLCYGEGLSTSEAARCLGIREAALRKRLQYGRDAIGAEALAEFREINPPAESERLKTRVLAALPLGTVPWTEAAAASVLSTLLGSKLGLSVLSVIVLAGIAGLATFNRNANDTPPPAHETAPVRAAVNDGQVANATVASVAPEPAIEVPIIEGTVFDDKTGKAVSGAKVEVGATEDFQSSGFVESNASGHFSLPRITFPYGALFARASLGKAVSKTVKFEYAAGKSAHVEIPLTPRGTITGRVTRPDGRPVPDAWIMRKKIEGGAVEGITRTNEDGRYAYEHDGGILVLYAGIGTVVSDTATIELLSDESRARDFALPNTARALFDLRLSDGSRPEKLTNTLLNSENSFWSSSSDLPREGGFFVLANLKPAAYRFLLMGDGFEGQEVDFIIDESLSDVTRTLHLMPARTSARIRVLDEQGRPMPKYRLSALWHSETATDAAGNVTSCGGATSFASAESGPDGIVAFKGLPPALYSFSGTHGLDLDNVMVPCTPLLQMRMAPNDGAAAPCMALSSHPFRLLDGTRDNSTLSEEDVVFFAITPSGRASQYELEIGTNTVYGIRSGYTAGVCRVTVTPGMTRGNQDRPIEPATITLGEAGKVSGYLYPTAADPVADKDIAVFPADLWETARSSWAAGTYDGDEWARFGRILAQHAATTEDGSFTLRFLPPGQYVLATDTEQPGVFLVSDPVRVVAGKETTGAVLVERSFGE